jgi:hypothetical protein
MFTVQELADKIHQWEHNAGESFTDYFMHDNVKDNSWAFWCLGKGFNEHGNNIIRELLAGNTCLDQELLYEIYPTYDTDESDKWIPENHHKNVLLWAEFLLDTPFYFNKVKNFFDEK